MTLKKFHKSVFVSTWMFLLWSLALTGANAQKSIRRLEALKFYQTLQKHPNALIIDTRPAYKFEEYRMKNAVLAISQKELLSVVKDQPKHKPLFVYCEIGDRSKRAVKVLAENGFVEIYELKAGLKVWMEEGFEVDAEPLNAQ